VVLLKSDKMVKQTTDKNFAPEIITKERLRAKKFAMFTFYFIVVIVVFVVFYLYYFIFNMKFSAEFWLLASAVILYIYIKNDIKKLKAYSEKMV